MVVIKYLKSYGDDLLLQTSFSDLGDHIFCCCFFLNKKQREHRHLGLTKSEGICKRFNYIPNGIESAKILNTGTKIRDLSSRTGQQSCFFIFGEKMVGSAAIKQGRSANRKHTFFFLPYALLTKGLYARNFFKVLYHLCKKV